MKPNNANALPSIPRLLSTLSVVLQTLDALSHVQNAALLSPGIK